LAEACGDCGAPFDVAYITGGQARIVPGGYEIPTPVHDPGSEVSLGEGNTPCVPLPTLGARFPMLHLHAKLEFLNPTGSFKDRGAATMVSVAKEHGVTEMVEDSSGNAGASVSAYASRAGIKSHIFVPAGAPDAKLRQIRAYGAVVHPAEGTRDAVAAAAVAYYQQHGLVYASHMMSPYFAEGAKAFAYEAVRQFNGEPPDHVVFPVGNGSLFMGHSRVSASC